MKEIFEKHMEKRAMSPEIIKESFKFYINQFDPDRIYLLEKEAAPFFQITEKQATRVLAQYDQGDFSSYEALNGVLQRAILRARQIRMNNPSQSSALLSSDKRTFAKTEKELAQRIKKHQLSYIEKKQTQDKQLSTKYLLAEYEDEMRDLEDNYLFVTISGEPLEKQQRDNLFALHLLKAFAASLDPHTRFFTNEEALKLKSRLEPSSEDEERAKYSWQPYGNGMIGVITLNSFYQGENGVTSEKDVKEAIIKLQEKGNLKGLVLDLRENSGGFLVQAVKVAGLFLTNGVVVISKYADGQERIYRDMDGKAYYSGPMIVLTSRATASAAEIVAQSLQDWGVALVVGDDHTYGKGTIQSQTVTDDGNEPYFKVTVGKYYTVSGKTPQESGVTADIVVPGSYSFEKIGEVYQELSLKQDQIDEAYSDTLNDIDPTLKKWYLRYYMPTLQRKEGQWRSYIEPLRLLNKKRVDKNQMYQKFLQTEESIEELDQKQLQEAVFVLQDMIDIHAQRYDPLIADE
jgi:C-terminal processing protease CtpA/Prc